MDLQLKLPNNRLIDLGLLFQRFLVLSQNTGIPKEDVMSHEVGLCPYPSLLIANISWALPIKQHLHTPSKNIHHRKKKFFLQFLQQRLLSWTVARSLLHMQNAMARGRFIQGNCSSVHAGFTALKYWMATVVFDRYPNEPHIKERVLVLYTYDEGGARSSSASVNRQNSLEKNNTEKRLSQVEISDL